MVNKNNKNHEIKWKIVFPFFFSGFVTFNNFIFLSFLLISSLKSFAREVCDFSDPGKKFCDTINQTTELRCIWGWIWNSHAMPREHKSNLNQFQCCFDEISRRNARSIRKPAVVFAQSAFRQTQSGKNNRENVVEGSAFLSTNLFPVVFAYKRGFRLLVCQYFHKINILSNTRNPACMSLLPWSNGICRHQY